jgi:exonuclease VII small subunit
MYDVWTYADGTARCMHCQRKFDSVKQAIDHILAADGHVQIIVA